MFRGPGQERLLDADALNRTLGAYAMKRALVNAGWSKEEIKEQHLAIMEARELVIEFMGGQEAYDFLPPGWRDSMFTVSALRMLVERADVEMAREEEIRYAGPDDV